MITEEMRFKTEDELVKEFGEDWRPEMNWVPMMNKLLGRNLIEFKILGRPRTNEQSDINRFIIIEDGNSSGYVRLENDEVVQGWYIDKRTLTPIEHIKKNHCKYRIKTREEFEKEFGEDWRNRACGFVTTMDGVLGEEIPEEIANEILEKGHCVLWSGNGKTSDMYAYGIEMITKCDSTEDKEEKKTEKGNKESNKDMGKFVNEDLIQSVTFNDKKKTVTVVLTDKRVGVSRCAKGDEYDQRIGFCIAYANAVFGSITQVQKVVEKYNGEEKRKAEKKELLDKLEKERALREYLAKQKKAEENKKATFEKQLAEYTKAYEAKKLDIKAKAEKQKREQAEAKKKAEADKKAKAKK